MSYVSISGVASLGVSAVFYLLSHYQSKKADRLNAVRTVHRLQDLEAVTQELGPEPVIVAATGRVASDAPLKCELNPQQDAVIRKVLEEEHRWVKLPSGRDTRDTHTTRQDTAEAHWHLEDGSVSKDGSGVLRVLVKHGSEAQGLDSAMERKQAYYRENLVNTLANGALNEAIGQLLVRRDGSTKTEMYLPLGTVVTVVGELARPTGCEGQGFAFLLRKPPSGPFYVTKQTLDQLRADLRGSSIGLKYLAVTIGTVGATLVLYRLITRLTAKYREWQFLKRRRRDLLANNAQPGNGHTAQVEQSPTTDGIVSEPERSPNICAVCLERECESVFMPCGHMCCCFTCGRRLSNCPICRARANCVRIYRV